MAKKEASCCAMAPPDGWQLESLVSVDERGQMVLPKEVRTKAGIERGDKLALVSCVKDGDVCCLTLMKAERLSAMVKGILGPVMKEIL
jgi:AbrB family looped-hinge helix DNA binding protein